MKDTDDEERFSDAEVDDWRSHPGTRRYVKAIQKRADKALCTLIAAAERSPDPEVCRAWAWWQSEQRQLEFLQQRKKQ